MGAEAQARGAHKYRQTWELRSLWGPEQAQGGQTVWVNGTEDHRTHKALGVERWVSFIYLTYVLRPTRDEM